MKILIVGLPLLMAAGSFCFPALAQEGPKAVQVTLKDGDLGFKEMAVEGGEARFEIENAGTTEHAFEIEGEIGGKEFEVASPVLKPGEKAAIIVGLPAGTYEAYCPVDDHRKKGMAGKVTFAD